MSAQKRIFLSHASADKALADLLRNTLVLCGVAEGRIFYSSSRGTGIPSGEDVGTYLRRSLQDAGLVIELLSKTFLVRPMCLMELGGAWTLETPTYPIVVPPLTRGEAIRQIGNVQMGVLGTDAEIGDIFDELHGRLAQDLGIQCSLTAWNQAIVGFRQQLPSGLAAAEAAAATAAKLSRQTQQERPRPEPPESAPGKPTRSRGTIDLRIASQLAEQLSYLDEPRHPSDWHVGPAHDDPYDRLIRVLVNLKSILTEILSWVDNDPRMMDSILEETHRLTNGIGNVMKQKLLGPDGPLVSSRSADFYKVFEGVRAAENDTYELYENDLERYRTLQLKDLDVVLKRRRAYISKLQDFQDRTSGILEYAQDYLARDRHKYTTLQTPDERP